jgi:Putative Ig domain
LSSAWVAVSSGASAAIAVSPRLAIAATRLEPARPGRRFRARIRTLGGVGPLTFKLHGGRLPAGVHLGMTTGALTGAPRIPGRYRLVIEARDALGVAARCTFVLAVR